MYYAHDPVKDQGPACILIIDGTHQPRTVRLKRSMTLGRACPGSDRDIIVSSQIVSRKHGEFIYDDSDGSYYYLDNNSLNGSFVNNFKLAPYNARGTKAVKLSDGDIIRIDRSDLNTPHPEAVLIIFSTSLKGNETWKIYHFSGSKVRIGRDQSCELVINDPMASREHAVISLSPQGVFICDNNSTNGVCVNGAELTSTVRLFPNDVIRIANTLLIFTGNELIYNYTEETETTLTVDIEKKVVGGGKVLLRDIQAQFASGDFVLILGGSGAGKTTLIKAILGESKANGRIVLNGQDLYQNFKGMKSQIGMVPQFLTLRVNDTVRDTLMDTASIKLGSLYSKAERKKRVEEVLEHVGIREHADKYIGQLSGGQQKKVSVANQLIGFQRVFICDEPDSGLDAASRTQQMEILKEISRQNKIVMVISHEPDDAVEIVDGKPVSLFTKVLVLARNSGDRAGHLAFFGDIDSAKKFFGVSRLQDIMIEINPPEEGGKGKADEYIERYMTIKDNNRKSFR